MNYLNCYFNNFRGFIFWLNFGPLHLLIEPLYSDKKVILFINT